MTIRIDPEFKELIPPLQPEEYTGLETDLIANGCRVPLDVWRIAPDECEECDNTIAFTFKENAVDLVPDREGNFYPNEGRSWFCDSCGWCDWAVFDVILIDGHNRYEICQQHDIPFETNPVELAGRTEALRWIINNQLNRRNLQAIDRIALVEKQQSLTDSIREKAKEDKKRKPGSVVKNSAQQKSRDQIAALAGVSHDTYKKGVEVLEKATPEQLAEMRGKKLSINRVHKDIRQQDQSQKRKDQRAKASASIKKMDDRIIVGDFRDYADQIPDNSLSLIFTDPPYDRKSLEMFPAISEFAAKKLCPGGSLLCYVGHIQLPSAVEALGRNLRYWWTVCCLHSGGRGLMREYGIRAGWKPVLWFVKETRDEKENIVQDVMSGGREKTGHDWQQAQSEAEYWIEALCPDDGVVCDLFLGAGTTAAAAKIKGREWIGFEIDQTTAKITNERINGN